MPELPDVEVFKQYLESTSLHKKIDEIEMQGRRLFKGISAAQMKRKLKGNSLASAHRHGKYLFIELANGGWLVLHFGMTGFLKYFKDQAGRPSHTRLLLHFSNGYHLAYDSQRKLGEIVLAADPASFIKKKQLGPDLFDPAFDLTKFRAILRKTDATIKSTLMNQKHMAGIGNIYSDEILFQAGVHPGCKTGQLADRVIEKLYSEAGRTLEKAIEARSDPDRLPSSFIIPHRRSGENCPKCKGKITKEKIAGRTSYFCPECQEC